MKYKQRMLQKLLSNKVGLEALKSNKEPSKVLAPVRMPAHLQHKPVFECPQHFARASIGSLLPRRVLAPETSCRRHLSIPPAPTT